jgi:hypothetical protein
MRISIKVFVSVLFLSIAALISHSCKKESTLPDLTTAEPSNIAQKTVTSGGTITSDGGEDIVIAGICWSTTSGPSVKDKHTNDSKEVGSYISNLTGLTPNTAYYIKAYAYTKAGVGYGNEVSFTTLPVVGATLTTADVTEVTSSTATSGGNITADGGGNISDRGVCWSPSVNPTIEDDKTSDGTGTGIFVSNIANLSPNMIYYLRAYATNSAGTSYGNELSFTTLGQAPIAITQPACCIYTTGGNLRGTVNANHILTTVTFEYGTSPSYGSTVTAYQSPVSGSTAVNVNAPISGLLPGTTFHFRIKAENSLGVTYGSDMVFTTRFLPPPTNGLVAYYPNNGNANDQTANGNHGTVNGATLTSDRYSNPYSAYSFDGINDDISGSTNNWPYYKLPRTISLWCTLHTLVGESSSNHILDYGLTQVNNANQITFEYVSGVGKTISYGAYFNAVSVSFDYNFDTWYNIVGTFDGTVASLYINGSLYAQQDKNDWNTLPGNFRLGSLDNWISWWNGKVDDIRIYNRVLSADEILSLYNEIP